MPRPDPRCWICLLLVLALMAACQSAEGARHEDPPPQPERPLARAPEAEAAVAAPIEEDEPFELAEGRYWIRRLDRLGVRSITGGRTLEGVEADSSRETGSTRCHPLEFAPGKVSPELRIDLRYSSGMSSTTLAFRARQVEGGWSLDYPTVERDGVSLTGRCHQELHVEAPGDDARFMESNAGPLFLDEESCHAAPSHFVETCEGEACRYDEPAAQPFALSDCEATIGRLNRDVGRVLSTSHDAAMRSLVALDERVRRGGELWAWVSEERVCGQVTVSPQEEGRVRMSLRYPIGDSKSADGGCERQMEETTDYWFAPAFRYARVRAHWWWERSDEDCGVGGGGGGGDAFGREVALYMAEGAVLLGGRWLYFERSTCEERAGR